jgi:SAM-dependent methyltransferase
VRKTFSIVLDSTGRAYLNLACGARTRPGWNNLDFSPYARLRRRPQLTSALKAVGLLSAERIERLHNIDPKIICWNLAHGVPFLADQFDMVYHSHFLEHLARAQAVIFLKECRRVLKPGGVLRVVVPDLELIMRSYQESLATLDSGRAHGDFLSLHEGAIGALLEQMVRTESTGTQVQKPWVRKVERWLRGNAAKTGEVHRWMYDRYSLAHLLEELDFTQVRQCAVDTSWIDGWSEHHLDRNEDGSVYKLKSLYMEARK